MLKTTFTRRFAELDVDFKSISFRPYESGYGLHVPDGGWEKWGTSVQNLIKSVFGEFSPHYKNYLNAFEKCDGDEKRIRKLHAVFMSAKEDFEGGYVFDVDLRISGEVFGDFVTLARQALNEGHKDVAAVLACAALEDSLKRFATSKGLGVDGKSMQEIVNSLKAASLVTGAQKSLLDAMPKIRNLAMHADWAKITEPDVSSVLGYVEQFLLSNF